MQINSKSPTLKYLIISLLVVAGVWLAANMMGWEAAKFTSDFLYIPLTTLLAMTALFQIFQVRKERNSIMTWSTFFIFAMSYVIAHHIGSLNELILDQKPFPSLADVAFIIFHASLILFFVLIIKSKKQFTSKWMFLISVPCSLFVIILSAYLFISSNAGLTLDQILLSTYPVLDAIALPPALIGLIIYFKNKLDYPLFLICISMIPLTIADILFQITTINKTLHSGDIPDLFFWIQIILLIFGIYIISNSKVRSNFIEGQN